MAGKDCDDHLHELSDYLHGGELTPEKTAHFSEHLDDCPPCLETADFQAELRAVIAKRCCEEVPAELRERIESLLRDPAS